MAQGEWEEVWCSGDIELRREKDTGKILLIAGDPFYDSGPLMVEQARKLLVVLQEFIADPPEECTDEGRKKKAVQMRTDGHTYSEIAEKLNFSSGQEAGKAIKEYLHRMKEQNNGQEH